MSLLSFFESKEGEVSLLIDIGNGSITGGLVLFKKGAIPEFLYALEVPFSVRETPSSAKLVQDMEQLLATLLETLSKQGFRHPYWKDHPVKIQTSLVVFSSPWFISKTKPVSIVNDSAFIVTQNFIDSIIKKEEELFTQEVKGEETGSHFKVVEKSIVHAKINGYTLENSIGKRTKSLEAFLYMSMIDEHVIEITENIILKQTHVPKNKMLVHTFPLASFSVFRDVFSGSSDFIIMDITSEVTDLSLVQNDVIQKSASIPSGRNFLIRQIMKKFEVNSEIAESTLHLYATDKLDEESAAKMEEVLTDVEKEWSIYLESGLSELSSDMILPGSVYLTVDPDIAPIYKHFLELPKTDTTAMFRKGVTINHIDSEATSSFYTAKGVKVNEFIAILAMFYNKMFQR